MDATSETQPKKNATTTERKSDREIVVTRTINGPARLVFEAWTKPELLQRWWVPKSAPIKLLSCEIDARVGGGYRLVFDVGGSQTMEFFGKYLEVTPHSRLVWTNEEAGEPSITIVTFTEQGGKTLIVMSELHPSKEAADNAAQAGGHGDETFDQLEQLLATLGGAVGPS
jgi:uncharacterized protein YndB with AHSA1/START domain